MEINLPAPEDCIKHDVCIFKDQSFCPLECGHSILDKTINAAKIQENPIGKGVEISALVKQDIESRALLGIKKYVERLTSNNGRDSLLDAYQEALDLCMYLRQTIEERKS